VRHPVPVYFGLTFAISWGGAAVAIAGGGGISWPVVVDPRFAYAVAAMLAGPSISGVLLTALVGGKAGLRDLLRRTLRARVAPRWHAAALLTAPLLWIATLAALTSTSPAFLPGIVTTTASGLGRKLWDQAGTA
jgi:hypothetical protein